MRRGGLLFADLGDNCVSRDSLSSQSEQAPQQTNTAWRSGVSSQPIRLGGEAGPSHRMQTGGGIVALRGMVALASGKMNEIGS